MLVSEWGFGPRHHWWGRHLGLGSSLTNPSRGCVRVPPAGPVGSGASASRARKGELLFSGGRRLASLTSTTVCGWAFRGTGLDPPSMGGTLTNPHPPSASWTLRRGRRNGTGSGSGDGSRDGTSTPPRTQLYPKKVYS